MRLETTRRWYKVDRSQISYIKFVLEAHDNVAVMSTVDPQQAVVQLRIAPGCERLVGDIMNDFSNEFTVCPVDPATLREPASSDRSDGGAESGFPASDDQRNPHCP
jgi:hypothetical protein